MACEIGQRSCSDAWYSQHRVLHCCYLNLVLSEGFLGVARCGPCPTCMINCQWGDGEIVESYTQSVRHFFHPLNSQLMPFPLAPAFVQSCPCCRGAKQTYSGSVARQQKSTHKLTVLGCWSGRQQACIVLSAVVAGE